MESETEASGKGLVIMMPVEFPYIILASVLLCIECLLFSYWTVKERRRLFTREWLADKFEEEHMQAVSEDDKGEIPIEISPGGFPDCGEGRYSEKLTYKDWLIFNQTHRVHVNFVESLPAIITILLVSGLSLPALTTLAAYVTIFLRAIGFILVINLRGTEGFNISTMKCVSFLLNDLVIYSLGVAAMGYMAIDSNGTFGS